MQPQQDVMESEQPEQHAGAVLGAVLMNPLLLDVSLVRRQNA